jgi:hypothetical protein
MEGDAGIRGEKEKAEKEMNEFDNRR